MWEILVILGVLLVYFFTRKQKKEREEETEKEIEETGKPDYKDYKISENIYQKKYVNKEEDTLPPLITHLISLILLSLFLYVLYGDGRRGTSESKFDNFLETWWIEFGGSIFSVILITLIFYGMFWGCLKVFLEKIELSWKDDDDEKYVRYEEDLEKWELNKTQIREREEERELKKKERKQNKKDWLEKKNWKKKEKKFWFGLNGLDTEKELNKVFEKLGFETELTPPSNDEGIDHVLNGEIVVQTKNQKKNVGRPDLQKFWGSWKDSHKKGIFVSIHGFSENCKEFVKDKPIILYDVYDVIGKSEGKKPEWKDLSIKDSEGS